MSIRRLLEVAHRNWADWEVAEEEDNPPQLRRGLGGRHGGTGFIAHPYTYRKATSGISRTP